MPIIRMMAFYMTVCFIAGWAIGSFALYSYLALSARNETLPEREPEEEEEPQARAA